MKKRIVNYRKYIENLLNSEENDWNEIIEDLKYQISIFQHERLVHLLVTILVAILAMLFFLTGIVISNLYLLVVSACLFGLFIPYIFHYYTLENETQKLYGLYDKIYEKVKRK